MSRGGQILLLTAALALTLGSSSVRRGAHGSKSLRPQRDKQLNHPALRLVNRSPSVMILRLRGPVKRDLLAPPRENVRTLLAAGVYRYEVRLGKRVVRRGSVRLRKGFRYHLEMAP